MKLSELKKEKKFKVSPLYALERKNNLKALTPSREERLLQAMFGVEPHKDEEEEKHAIIPSTQAFVELIQEKAQDDNPNNNIELVQKAQNSEPFQGVPTLDV